MAEHMSEQLKQEQIYVISHGDYQAEFSEMGAALVSLTYKGNDLVERRTHPRYFSGEILAPWPNRIADGCYKYQGETFQIPTNESARQNALHGFVFNKIWKVISDSKSEIIFQIEVSEPDKYPTTLDLKVNYKIGDLGLSSQITATNTGVKLAPYGASTHPYFLVPGLNSVDDFYLKIGASKVLLTDSVRLLPKELMNVDSIDFDFRTPRQIGPQFIDHAFLQDSNLPREISIGNKFGAGVLISFDESTKWIQIHTADRNGGPDSRKALAIEPMTCPPDAFNSKIDLVELKPGETHQLTWQIQSI